MQLLLKFLKIILFIMFLPVIIAAFLLLGMFGASIRQVINGITKE